MAASTVELMSRGMRCLVDNMGIVEAEEFISLVIQEKFDYTRWQRDFFDSKTKEEISAEASAYEKDHPYTGSAVRI